MKFATCFFIVLALYCHDVEAARWGPNGHPEITFDVITQGDLHVPEDIGKVMAIGSAAPDFFEFDNPNAHAQTPDPPLTKSGVLAISAKDYQARHETAYSLSEEWSEFYFSSAVSAMKSGHRERAAFLLGYALHNREDLATHRGMTNLVHSALDYNGQSPDSLPARLAAAHEMASLEIFRFKEAVGQQNWDLFRGETVRSGSIGSIIPEPLTFATDLKDWNPRSGIIPSTPSAVRTVQSLIDSQYKSDTRGVIHEATAPRVKNYLAGFFQRQDRMLRFLQIVRGPNDPKLPSRRGKNELRQDALDAAYFACKLSRVNKTCVPKKYQRLSAADQNLLESLEWDKLHKAKIKHLRELRQKHQDAILQLYKVRLAKLNAIADRQKQYRKELISSKGAQTKRNDRKIVASAIRPPTINGNLADDYVVVSGSGNSSNDSSSGSKSSNNDRP